MKLRYVPIAALLLLAPLLALYRAYWAYQVSVERDKLRALGYPATQAEFAAWYALPEGEPNAAELYERAFEAYGGEGIDLDYVLVVGSAEPPRVGPLPQRVREETRRFLDANSERLALLQEAGGIEHCRFPVDFQLSPWEMLEEGTDIHRLTHFRPSAKLLSAALICELDERSFRSAIRTLESLFALGRALYFETSSVSVLIAASTDSMALENAAGCLTADEWSADELRELDGLLERETPYRSIESAILGAINLQLRPGQWFLDDPAAFFSVDTFADRFTRNTLWGEVYGRSDHELWRTLRFAQWHFETEASRKSHPLFTPPPLTLMTDDEWSAYQPGGSRQPSPDGFADVYFAAVARRAVEETRIAMSIVRVAIRMELHRLETGAIPGSIAEIDGGAISTTDPFDGQPFRFVAEGQNYWIYSVGRNGVDDGGYDLFEGQAHKDDIVIAIVRELPPGANVWER